MKLCLIVASQNRGSILDRIAHEIGKSFEAVYSYGIQEIPPAEHYFVSHYSLLPGVFEQVNPLEKPVTVFFTHDKGGLGSYLPFFNLCHAVVAESPEGMEVLRAIGVKPSLLHFVPECGDNEAFQPHARQASGAVLICGTNYPDGRKNPELVRAVMDALPERPFMLVGNWIDTFEYSRPNVTFSYSQDYLSYPHAFSQCSVYLSCSKLEGGGPNSLIEAMHSNIVPVVSDTGNARQYITHGYNGFIFGMDAKPAIIALLIEEAYKLHPQDFQPYNDVWQSVQHFTWPVYSLQMKEIITGDYSTTASQTLDSYLVEPD